MNPDWTTEAASLPLAFAQVREDPRLDVALASTLPPGATAVMIASGGDSAVQLGRLPLDTLHLVDMNPAQLALTKVKWLLAGQSSPGEACALLGHTPMPAPERSSALQALLSRLELPADALGPPALTARLGPDHAGRYERCFAALTAALAPFRNVLDRLLHSTGSAEASALAAPEAPFGKALDRALSTVMSLGNLVRLFGHEATQNPRQPFHRHFATRLRTVLARQPARTNPFLWQMLAGTFPPETRYDWLQPEAAGKPLTARPVWHTGRMAEVLRSLPEESADFVHLSNILDWLTPMEAGSVLGCVFRVLKPGGRVILRQLNSSLEIPGLHSGLQWDGEESARLEARDRSFFYSAVHAGRKP